jgi:hypothetical protein
MDREQPDLLTLVGHPSAGYREGMKIAPRRLLFRAIAVCAVSVLAPIAAAQSVQPPKVQELDSGGTILTYVIGFVLAAIAVGLAAMPSQREHQD